MNSFTFDGRNSLEWGIGLSGSGVWDAPVRRGEMIAVPGRNGNVWVDDGTFDNIEVIYPCWISDGFNDKVDDFRAYMMAHSDNYFRLEDTYHPEEFRLARYPGPFSASPGTRNLTGRFDLTFDCDPRRFLKSGEEDLVPSAAPRWQTTYTVYNPTYFPAYPSIFILTTISGSSIAINDAVIEFPVAGVQNFWIDCETMVQTSNGEIVYGKINAPERPVFLPGNNTVVCTGGNFGADPRPYKIIPRWWTI